MFDESQKEVNVSDATSSSETETEVVVAPESEVKTEEVSSEEKAQEKVSQESSETTIDYEALLKQEREKVERAKNIAHFEREKRKQLQKVLHSKVTEEETDGVPETEVDLKSVARAEVETVLEAWKREEKSETISELLDEISDNEHEKELIKLKYENELKPTGFSRSAIKNDLFNAKLIVNRPHLESQLLEKAKAQAKKSIAEKSSLLQSASKSGGVGRQPPQSDEPSMSAKEKELLSWAKKAADRYSNR